MYLKSLQLQNWMIFQDAFLEFEKGQIIGIVGRYTDGTILEKGKSNRAGKSSLVEALRFLFYGKGRNRSQVKLINRTAFQRKEKMLVKGVIVFRNESELEIVRGREIDGSPIIEISGHEGLGWQDANQILEGILGFSLKEYENTCYFGQGDIHGFMSSTPKAKRTLILNWLGQERWKAREIKAKESVDELSPKIEAYKQILAGLPELTLIDDLEKELEETQKKWDECKSQIGVRQNLLETLQKNLDQAKERERKKKEAQFLKEQITQLQENFLEAKDKLRQRETIAELVDDLNVEISQEEKNETKEIGLFKEELGKLQGEGKIIAAKLEDLESVEGICPLLGEGCDRVDKNTVQETQEKLKKLRKKYRMRMSRYEATQRIYEKKLYELRSKRNDLNGQILLTACSNPEDIQNQINDIKKKLNDLKLPEKIKMVKLNALEEKYFQTQRQLKYYQEEVERAAIDHTSIKTRLEEIKTQQDRKQQLEDQLEKWECERAAWAYCKYMFSDRGIPGDYLSQAFATMETDINFILNRIGLGIQVEIKPYRITKVWEPSCLACGYDFPKGGKKKCPKCKTSRQKKRKDALLLEIIDFQEGQKSEFDLDSGGGQTLISFAVRLALLLLKIREGRDDPPPIILDEIVGSLDAHHRQAIMDLVLNVLPSDYGLDQIWWISHIEEVQESLETKLQVVREGEKSVVQWV